MKQEQQIMIAIGRSGCLPKNKECAWLNADETEKQSNVEVISGFVLLFI